MNTRILGGLAAAAMLVGGFAFTTAGTVSADAINDAKVCEGLTSGKIDTTGEPQTITITPADYPAGNLITGYCVKAGSDNQVGGGPVYVTVAPTASITFGHPSGKAVSHYSFTYAPPAVVVVPPTPTPEIPVTPIPETPGTPTPTPEVPATPTATQDVVAALPPVQAAPAVAPAVAPARAGAPAQAAAPAAARQSQALPSTGIDSTGVTALIALLLTSLGGAAVFLSRRYNVTS